MTKKQNEQTNKKNALLFDSQMKGLLAVLCPHCSNFAKILWPLGKKVFKVGAHKSSFGKKQVRWISELHEQKEKQCLENELTCP